MPFPFPNIRFWGKSKPKPQRGQRAPRHPPPRPSTPPPIVPGPRPGPRAPLRPSTPPPTVAGPWPSLRPPPRVRTRARQPAERPDSMASDAAVVGSPRTAAFAASPPTIAFTPAPLGAEATRAWLAGEDAAVGALLAEQRRAARLARVGPRPEGAAAVQAWVRSPTCEATGRILAARDAAAAALAWRDGTVRNFSWNFSVDPPLPEEGSGGGGKGAGGLLPAMDIGRAFTSMVKEVVSLARSSTASLCNPPPRPAESACPGHPVTTTVVVTGYCEAGRGCNAAGGRVLDTMGLERRLWERVCEAEAEMAAYLSAAPENEGMTEDEGGDDDEYDYFDDDFLSFGQSRGDGAERLSPVKIAEDEEDIDYEAMEDGEIFDYAKASAGDPKDLGALSPLQLPPPAVIDASDAAAEFAALRRRMGMAHVGARQSGASSSSGGSELSERGEDAIVDLLMACCLDDAMDPEGGPWTADEEDSDNDNSDDDNDSSPDDGDSSPNDDNSSPEDDEDDPGQDADEEVLISEAATMSLSHPNARRSIYLSPPLPAVPGPAPRPGTMHYASASGRVVVDALRRGLSLPASVAPARVLLRLLGGPEASRALPAPPGLRRAANRLDWAGVEAGMAREADRAAFARWVARGGDLFRVPPGETEAGATARRLYGRVRCRRATNIREQKAAVARVGAARLARRVPSRLSRVVNAEDLK